MEAKHCVTIVERARAWLFRMYSVNVVFRPFPYLMRDLSE